MKKQILTVFAAAALAAVMLPAAGAAVDSADAQAYLGAMDAMPGASSYLVDFDGDGSDELLLAWKHDSMHQYEVWKGAVRLGQGEAHATTSLFLTQKADQVYLTEYTAIVADESIDCFTVTNGKWIRIDHLGSGWSEGVEQYTCEHNGSPISHAEFESLWNAYRKTDTIATADPNAPIPSHSVRNELLAALDTGANGYKDVLSSLSASERKVLFESFLPPFSGYDADYRTISDQKLLQMINDAWYDHNISFDAINRLSWIDLPNYDRAITKSDADKLTTALFGRTLDFSKFKRSTLPDLEDSNNFCYVYQNMLCFHAYFGMGGFPGTIQFIPQHLYDLGSGYFAAGMMEEWCHDDGTLNSDLYYSVIKKNTDSTYRFIRTYPANYVPSDTELAAFVAPSDWAKAEVEAAETAGLIPELNGNPTWQDNATRLHFAQLAVRLAESVTGETLPAAPASTFTDCTDIDVRKAYAAGIVNGTSATTFSPDSKLTREQLATMLWRAADYIQQQTGEQVLTAGGSLTSYTDASRVSNYAAEAVATLANYGIMKGTSATALSPQQNCSVEQSVLLTYRMLQQLI